MGTRFRLRLPAIESGCSEGGEGSREPAPALNATVLLVEDDAMVRASLARQLQLGGRRGLGSRRCGGGTCPDREGRCEGGRGAERRGDGLTVRGESSRHGFRRCARTSLWS